MMQTKKELGQHWLTDDSILAAISEAADVQADDYVLEIGPGLGTLTSQLAERGAKVLALEFDVDLLGGLHKKFKNSDRVEIKQGDIRRFNFNELPTPYKIVANIPYYLTSHLIRSISETTNSPSIAALLVQKEVAERICAKPGDMSILGVTAQYYFDTTLDILVPARFFSPPPKVDSQVVVLKRKNQTKFDESNEKDFFRLVKAGFSEKRKTLRNSLSGGLAISKDEAVAILDVAQVEPGRRAQTVSLDEWYALFSAYNELNG